MLSLYWQRKRQPIIIGLLLHLRPQMNIFQNLWLLQEFFFFSTEYSATSTQALCGKLFNSFVFTLAKYLVLAHFERKPAGFSVLLQIFKQPCLPPSWKSIEELDMCLNKQARKKNRDTRYLLCWEWVISLMPHKEKTSDKFSHKEESAFGQL